ncbi:IS110 family transposase [Virgibacillus sp. MSP4-1]|uniref:IS110 family transposase n=1 Tax=Virgibacillus sp. MSP4-1 TaxID=2700081 RepID=UPI00137BA692|nr:IS110 family transposase [Virgibacillus sp. MSP4-1]QHS21830.1 IS110 family transposase [Virgibacillus sp. MSP4-1]QHS23375.1 IS110 family transposase [Virgibacillus sp. MSP4-1]QHS23378.1 IS110 family transposase [Virgibacillus sp. MSP4-1]QHS24372.1 IS110 family transposase [Virgibacillus sp. MSP4-1]
MVSSLLNHIQGKNGSRWADFLRKVGAENLLIVAVDAAKYTHKGMICTFYGEILVRPFEFDASMSGFQKLKHHIKNEMDQHNFKKVVMGVETTGHYYEDLVHHSKDEGYQVRILNAATTANERKSILNGSKTDNLDLMAIVQSIIYGRGTSSELATGKVHDLQKLTRARRELVKGETAVKNLIRVYLDYIFREFQGKSVWKDGKHRNVKPFSQLFGKAPRYIMRHCLHPSDILSLGAEGLRELSIRENLKMRDQSIETLLAFAKYSISKPKDDLQVEHYLLKQQLDQLELLERQIKNLERQIEDLFVQTEGAVTLSVSGIGVVTGAELYAEMGDISDFDHAGQLIKMAGTNPIVKQSGDRSPSYYAVSKQGRRTFRNIVYQVGRTLARNNPDMKQKYLALLERGKYPRQAYIAIGNRMIRLAYSMIKHQTLYRTSHEDYTLQDQISKKLHRKNASLFYEKFVLSNEELSA